MSALAAIALMLAAPTPAERRAVLDALRPAVEAQLGANVEFVVQAIRVEGGWAFVLADPQRKGGRAIDGRRIYGEDSENMDGLTVTAVLKRQPRGWTVAPSGIGATDVWYCDIGPRKLKRGYGC